MHAGLGLNHMLSDVNVNDINDIFWVAGDGDLIETLRGVGYRFRDN